MAEHTDIEALRNLVFRPAPPPGFPHDDPSPERIAKWWNDAVAAEPGYNRMHVLPGVEMTITGPALHDTQVRAYALMAAANLTPPNSRPNADDLLIWRANVLRTAQEFEKYIRPTKKSEDL